MAFVVDSSSSLHLSQRESCKHRDAGGKLRNDLSEMSTMETMPTLSDLLESTTLDELLDWDLKDSSLDDRDETNVYDQRFASESRYSTSTEFSADEGRRCEINYSDFEDDLMSAPPCSALDDPMLTEMPAESHATKKCIFTFPVRFNPNDPKPSWRIKTRSYKDEEEALEDQLVAKFKSLTQFIQKAEEAQDRFPSEPKGFSQQFPATRGLNRQISAPVDNLGSHHRSFGRQLSVSSDLEALPSQNVHPPPQKNMRVLDFRCVTLKRVPVGAPVPKEDAKMETFAGAPGRALRKMRASNFQC